MGQTIAFWVLGAAIILFALGVMFQKNIFRAALALILCLIGVAGIFVLLSADFLAGAQILIYVGAISVIIILAIMLTHELFHGNPSNSLRYPAIAITVLFFGLVSYFMLRTDWNVSTAEPVAPTTEVLSQQLFSQNGFILPISITAVLLLAVIIGAVVIAREK